MSNIAIFQSGAALPDYLRDADDSTTKAITGGAGGKQISIKGGVWRMVVGGEEVAKNEDRAMNFVIIAASEGVSRTFYAEKYVEGQDQKPACWSAKGDKPGADVPKPQSSTCATCPQNIEGSGEGKSRACRFSKRLAVTVENDISGNVYRLSVPAKSYFGKAEGDKMPLQAFGKFLAGHGIPITGIVTEARFDTNEAVPVMKFRAVRPLTRDEWEAAKAQSLTEEAKQAIELKVFTSREDAEPQVALPQAFQNTPIPAAEEPVKVAAEPVAEPVKRASKAAAAPVEAPKNAAEILDQWGSDDE